MTIPYAPENVPTANMVELDDDQTTGPLSLGFEFEFFGIGYRWFDLSADGFLTFGLESRDFWPGSHPTRRFIPVNPDLNNFLALGWSQEGMPERVRITYELRGTEGRLRMVLAFTGAPPRRGPKAMVTGQLILRERTGMIEVHSARQDPQLSKIDERAARFTTSARRGGGFA